MKPPTSASQHHCFTGRIYTEGAAKTDRARQFLRPSGGEIEWDSSYAYGDSFTDPNLLELVGQPVAHTLHA